jgi:hypothetical protein
MSEAAFPSEAEIRRAIERGAQLQIIQAMRVGTDKAAKSAVRAIRQGLSARRAGRLGNAISSNSDLNPGKRAVRAGFHTRSDGSVSVSGRVFVRGGGARTKGAIASYVENDTTTISPRNASGLLWIPTDEIQRLVGIPKNGGGRKSRVRLEPRFWNQAGLDRKIGPLVRIRSVDGTPLLVVLNASVAADGRPGRAKSLRKNGLPRKGQRAKAFIVAFIGIRQTTRTSKVDLTAIAEEAQRTAVRETEAELNRLTRGNR